MTDGGNKSSPLQASLCFAPWDSAILDVKMSTKGIDGHQTSDILRHLPSLKQNGTRYVLALQRPSNFLGDLPPPHRRPIVQSNMSGNMAAKMEFSSPLSGNRSALMTSTVRMRNLQPDVLTAGQVTVVNPALAAIFKDTLNLTSIEWAMSTLITVLFMTNFCGQQPAFDRVDSVTVAYFENFLYPQN